VYLVMNNGTYGLTKGQPSPTAGPGIFESTDEPLDAVTIGLAIAGSTFIARGFARWPDHLDEIVTRGLAHARSGNGFAFVEVMSPCVTYNDTYPDWSRAMLDANEIAGHDPSDRAAALSLCIRAAADGRIPGGVLLETENVSFESRWSKSSDDPPANPRPRTSDEDLAIEQIMMSYTV
jgi:2-oxoglutarate ferredoxin oxidoreductase subunit beta